MAQTSINVVGRKKEAVVRARLSSGNGQIMINGKTISDYFPGLVAQKVYSKPTELTGTHGKYTISLKVAGGGSAAQLQAVVHAMARALVKAEPALRVILKKAGYLTRDARVKERRKYGNAQKARAKKQSPKR